jgi:hypothetical protein
MAVAFDPDAIASVPQATLFGPAEAPAPSAAPGGTAAPVALPMHTNCAAAGLGASATARATRLAEPSSRMAVDNATELGTDAPGTRDAT